MIHAFFLAQSLSDEQKIERLVEMIEEEPEAFIWLDEYLGSVNSQVALIR